MMTLAHLSRYAANTNDGWSFLLWASETESAEIDWTGYE